MISKLLIIGASGHGKVIYDIAENTGRFDEICFLDDNSSLQGVFYKSKVIGTTDDIHLYLEDYCFIVAIGDNKTRNKKQLLLNQLNAKLTILIDETAVVSDTVSLGEGVVIMPKAVVNADVAIGKGVILNSSCIVEHDCNIGEFCHISPSATICGTVNIGARAWVGANSTVINNISICNDVIVGAGSVVISDISECDKTYVGFIK